MSKIDFDNIVYINRDIDFDRKTLMEYQFKKYGVEAKRFNAISSNFDQYSSDYVDILRANPLPGHFYDNIMLSSAEIGCLLSHLECIRLYGDKDLIVLEDDADLSTSEHWNFNLSDIFSKLQDDVEILQMVKYAAYYPVKVKKLKIGNEEGGNWGTAAYLIKSSLSKKIVSEYYVDGKWQILKMPCLWNRKTADAILYSFDGAYTCTLFSLAQYGKSTINPDFNPSLSAAAHISNYFNNNKISIEDYFE